jgi:hypothetical protein
VIGNLDLIIDIVAKQRGVDRKTVEGIAVETFKRFKTRMGHSSALSLYLPQLGYFICMNRHLRRYVREHVKKVRLRRNKIKLCKYKIESVKDETERKDWEKQLEGAIIWEGIYLKNLKTALIQLNALRIIFYESKERKIERDKNLTKDERANRILKTYSQRVNKPKGSPNGMDK